MKPIRFLPFLAACLSLGAHESTAFASLPEKPKERRKFRRTRDGITKSIFRRRWTWGTPHVGKKQAAKLERRAILDARAAEMNPAWK